MSQMPRTRRHLAELVNTVEGIKVSPYWTQSLEPGHGCVLWAARAEDDDDFPDGWVESWQIRVHLPRDIEPCEQFIERVLDPLISAVQADRYRVTRADPAEVNVGGATTNALVLYVDDLVTTEEN